MLRDLRDHDRHRLGIDHRLGVAALLEATTGDRHDAGIVVGEVDPVVGTRAGGGCLGRFAARLASGGRRLGHAGGELGLMVGLLARKALGGARLDLDLGLGDGRQAILAALELLGQTHAVGKVGGVGLLPVNRRADRTG
jgi:hypothetical protein